MIATDIQPQELRRLRLRVRGAVQGVGFRPFAHALAAQLSLSGFVRNDSEGVVVEIEGAKPDTFVDMVAQAPPPLARIDAIEVETLAPLRSQGFAILDSVCGPVHTSIGPDAALCETCLDELFDPRSRFYLYPFVSCTHCGPRLTITRSLPYDRARTSMAGFGLCQRCARDYADPADRRFHAEAIACAECGPRLSHEIGTIVEAVRAGAIVALKGIGGFHLICDARNEAAVRKLRARKARDAKPFAIMVANAASAAQVGELGAAEADLLQSRARPIVLMPARGGLALSVAPALGRIGIMLPYAPVHHLLFHAAAGAPRLYRRTAANDFVLVATSANPGGEPLVVDDADARQRLGAIADLLVTQDRGIVVRADDSVMQIVDGAPAFLRRSRGFVPEPIALAGDGPCVLALGAHLKTTVTLTRGREAFVSQHIGDLDTAETIRFHEETVRHLCAILDIRPEVVACDLHPDFRTTRMAEAMGLGLVRAQHHAAHIAAVVAEHRVEGPVLGVALDGHGYGADGAAWGGELLRFEAGRFTRLGHLAPLALPGGDRAAREPWRMGVAALAALGELARTEAIFPARPRAAQLAAHWRGAPQPWPLTTSMGRLFDAAAALAGVCLDQRYEGQAAMEFETLVRAPRALDAGFSLRGEVLDFAPLLAFLVRQRLDPRSAAELFHGTLIAGVAAWIAAAAARQNLRSVAFGGGCFLNRVLSEGLAADLRARGLAPLLARAVPPNDGGLSLGQAAMARAAYASEDLERAV
jgi:hydrogenase maturation protein HypF